MKRETKQPAATKKKAPARPPRKPGWTVDGALKEVFGEIGKGHWPLGMAAGARSWLDTFYRKSFERMHDEGESWHVEKFRVLPLARAVGFLAALAETCDTWPSPPVRVSKASAEKAALTVAELCREQRSRAAGRTPAADDPTILGGWCDTGSGPLAGQPADIQSLVQALALRKAGPGKR